MPQPGETKTINGVTGQWDGQTWRQVSAPSSQSSSSSLLDYIPGLRDVVNLPSNLAKGASAIPGVVSGLYNNPTATLKGFVQGASDAATPDRVGLLALLTGGAGAASALAAAGGEAGAKGLQVMSGSPNAPKSFSDAALQTGEAAAIPAIPAGINKGVKAVQAAVPKANGGGVTGAILGGYEGYKRGGVLGGLEGAGTGYFLGSKASRLGKLVDSLTGDAEGAAAAPSKPNVTVTDQGNVPTPQTTNLLRPARFSTETPTAPAAGWDVNPDFQKFASDSPVTTDTGANANAQEYMSNLLKGGVMDRANAMGDATMNSLRNAGYDVPTTGGISTRADLDRLVASRPSVEGISQVDETPDVQTQPNDVAVDSMLDDLGTRLNQIPSGSTAVTGSTPDILQGRTPAPTATMPSSWEKFSSASDSGTRSAAPEVPMPDSISAIDKMFGPGSTDLQGQPMQSTSGRGGNNLLYDPQTPTDYLREQYLDPNASDADRSFLGRALRQRLRLGNSMNSVSALTQ